MPELPEVQTVVSQLGSKIVGATIASVWSDWRKAVRPSLDIFSARSIGASVSGTRRYGKHIVIDLDNSFSIVIHLKMTGHLLVKTPINRQDVAFSDPFNQFIHHILTFSDESTLEFSDMRKFGWMEIMETASVERLSSIASLGVDALSPKLTNKVFENILSKRGSRRIGELLLDQSLIAGIGNIYRSEALFRAHVLPERTVSTLSPDEGRNILLAFREVLREALSFRGMSDGDFRDTDGKEGLFQKELGVYGRDGKPCPKCGTMIRRIKLGQRSAFFCPACQV